MATLLAIDDEPKILDVVRLAFNETAFNVLTASTAADGVSTFAKVRPDVVLLDVNMPDMTGLDVYRRLRGIDRRVPVIFLTGETTTNTAIEAMALGAFEYLPKPVDFEKLRAVVEEAHHVRQLMLVPAVIPDQEKGSDTPGDVLVGRCPAMREVYKSIGRMAVQDATVLILGESGTGKELIARAIYQHSMRADGPFMAVNCAAIPEALFESELFGHEKGAFTGADRRRIGKFEQCSSGTLFLDEIGEMPFATQAKILRVLQEKTIERVGGSELIPINVRLIAATNRDLLAMVHQGEFRGDLYYRLNVFSIAVPPLRERQADFPELTAYFLKRFAREMNRDIVDISPEAMAILQRYSWPGNIRELQSVLRQSLLPASGNVLLPEFLPETVRAREKSPQAPAGEPHEWSAFIDAKLREGTTELYKEWLALGERTLFQRVLAHTKGNVSQAARILGLHRNTLHKRLDELGLQPK